MDDLTFLFLCLTLFLTGFFLVWFFIHKARTKERLLLIEKGMDKSNLDSNGKKILQFSWLKIGIVISGISLGLIIISASYAIPALNRIYAYGGDILALSGITLFGGISMIIAHFVGGSKEQK